VHKHICPIEVAILRSPMGRLYKKRYGHFQCCVTRDYRNQFQLVLKLGNHTIRLPDLEELVKAFDSGRNYGNLPITFEFDAL